MATTTLNLTATEYKLLVQKGGVPGTKIMQGFGEIESANVVAQGVDIWRYEALSPIGADRVPMIQDAGELISVVSESQADNGTSVTGVTEIEIHYIDPAGNEQETLVTLNGTTPVNTTILMRHIQYVHTTAVGSNGVAEGNIHIYKTGDNTATGIYNCIIEGGNMSLTTNRMIPLGKTLYLQSWNCSEAKDKRGAFRLRSTDQEGVITPSIFLFKETCYLRKTTSGELHATDVIPALSIVKVSAWFDQADAEGTASWWGYLVDD